MAGQTLADFVRASLFGYRTAPAWWFEADHADVNAWMPAETRPVFEPGVLVAGRTPRLQWTGSDVPGLVPSVVVAPSGAYLRSDEACRAFEPPPGLTRLEKVLAGRWVRTDAEGFVRRDDFSPEQEVDAVLRLVTSEALEGSVLVGEDEPAGIVTVACAGATWTLRRDGSGWSADRLGYYVDLRLGYGPAPATPVVPEGDDVVEAQEIVVPLGLLRVPRKPTPTSADVDPPDDDEVEWTVSRDELHELLGARHAVEAQARVVEELRRRRSTLVKRVEFDSEALLFVAYCRDRRDALALRDVIDDLIRGAPARRI